jgi:hypothetical protein
MPHILLREARAYVDWRHTSWSYVTPMSANAVHLCVTQRILRPLYSHQTGFCYLPAWLQAGIFISRTKWIYVLVVDYTQTLFQFHRLFSVERYAVFNKWHSEWRHYQCPFIRWFNVDAVSRLDSRASTGTVINEWWSGKVLEENCTVLMSGTATEFATRYGRTLRNCSQQSLCQPKLSLGTFLLKVRSVTAWNNLLGAVISSVISILLATSCSYYYFLLYCYYVTYFFRIYVI